MNLIDLILNWSTSNNINASDDELGKLVKLIEKIEREAEERTAKAFGGCKKCYGKGYSTVMDKTTYHADFIGDKSYTKDNDIMKYCSCNRGKQLQAIKDK